MCELMGSDVVCPHADRSVKFKCPSFQNVLKIGAEARNWRKRGTILLIRLALEQA
jgi:hypothetical protein